MILRSKNKNYIYDLEIDFNLYHSYKKMKTAVKAYNKRTNALLGNSITRSCHNAPIGHKGHFDCICASLLPSEGEVDPKDLFDELGNYRYCQGVIYSVCKKSATWTKYRKAMKKRLANEEPLGYRQASAYTILKYDLVPHITNILPGAESKKDNINVVKRMLAEGDHTLIQLKIDIEDTSKHPEEPGKNDQSHSTKPQSSFSPGLFFNSDLFNDVNGVATYGFEYNGEIIPIRIHDSDFQIDTLSCTLKFTEEDVISAMCEVKRRKTNESVQSFTKRIRQN